jgi:hypothetical protein
MSSGDERIVSLEKQLHALGNELRLLAGRAELGTIDFAELAVTVDQIGQRLQESGMRHLVWEPTTFELQALAARAFAQRPDLLAVVVVDPTNTDAFRRLGLTMLRLGNYVGHPQWYFDTIKNLIASRVLPGDDAPPAPP